ncbi:MAG TPA: sigma-54 dependent transcriptional regulator [Gemmatimonadales bacterium]
MTVSPGVILPGPDHGVHGLRLLGVGEDSAVFRELERCAESEGAALERVRDAAAALRAIARESWNAVMVLLAQDPDEQLGWWADVLRNMPRRPRLIVMAPGPSIGFALRAAQLGVFEVLPVPVGRERGRDLLRRLRTQEEEVVLPLPGVRPVQMGPHEMVSECPAMLPIFRTIAQVAPSTAAVLITGESGTGKELVARAVHQHGPRRDGPFVAVNCAAIPENLLESELFGHEKGAFTGAVARKVGRFERAHLGTLFLDEIGDMSLALQSKILRVLQEREIERVGGGEPIPVDVRLIAATNRDLKRMMGEARFREDLYFRLAVVTIALPRLADRGEDLIALTAYFLGEFGKRAGKAFAGITDRAADLLRGHEWVGNVRELRNVIERAVLVAEGDVLRAEHLPEEWRTDSDLIPETAARPVITLKEIEARHIQRALDHTQGQIGDAAQLLGVHRNTLARKIREYGL